MRRAPLLVSIVLALAGSPALAGPPRISVEAQSGKGRDGMLTIRVRHHGRGATLTGTAEGLVDGKRTSLPLELRATGKPDVYVVSRQWPERGAWLLHLTAWEVHDTPRGRAEMGHAVLVAPPDPTVRLERFLGKGVPPPGPEWRPITPAEVDAELAKLAAKAARK